MNYDVIVIGGGLAGLASALKIAQNGKKVAIFEKHHMPGGYATNFKRKDSQGNFYIFDVALHGIGGLLPGNPFYNYLSEMGMMDKITFLRKEETGTIYSHTTNIDIPDSFESYKAHLVNRFPEELEGIERLFEEADLLKSELLTNKPSVIYQKLQSMTLYDYLKIFSSNEQFIHEFSIMWLYYGLPPQQLNALYYMLAWISYHIGGTFYVEGGAGKLSDTFASEIKKFGGDIYLSSEIIKIDTSNNTVTAIHTKKGEIYTANQFIWASDPNHLISLMDHTDPSVKQYKNKLDHQDIGLSLSQLYIGLDCKSTELGITKGDYFISETDHESAYENALKGNYQDTVFGVTSYDILDPNLNKNVGAIVIVIADDIKNWPEYRTDAYKQHKQKVTNELLDILYKYFPDVKGHVTVTELGTPHTMKRYTNNTNGAVYGWEQNIRQGGFKRLSNKSDFDNVFLAGSWTNPGGGFEGALTGGILTAERVLRQFKNTSQQPNPTQNTLLTPDMPLKTFMIGMAANFNSSYTKQTYDKLIAFIFDEKDTYYIHIKNKSAKLITKKPSREPDITIRTTYKVWYNIAFHGLNGKDAMFDGKLIIKGDLDLFMDIQQCFATPYTNSKESAKPKKLNTILWITLSLVPWFMTGILKDLNINDTQIAFSAILYIFTLILFIKPNHFKKVTFLESFTLLFFSGYGLLSITIPDISNNLNSVILDLTLSIIFFISVICRHPITSDYAKYAYNDNIVHTKLFTIINRNLTLIWAIIFISQMLINLFTPNPYNNFTHILSIIGLLFSHFYPKIKLGL